MKRRFKSKKRKKLNKYLFTLLIYVSFSITYNTLFNTYVSKLSTEETITTIINDTKDNKVSNNFLDKYKSPEYILKLTLDMDLTSFNKQTAEVLQEELFKYGKSLEENELIEKMTGKKVELKYEINKDIIGGLMISYDGKVIDGSVKTQLKKLQMQLI